MVLGYAIVGAVVAFIPGVSFFLIALEVVMVYQIAHRSPRFNMFEFLGLATLLVAASVVLKGLAFFLNAIPLFGQLANSAVAFGFIQFVGHAAERHYE